MCNKDNEHLPTIIECLKFFATVGVRQPVNAPALSPTSGQYKPTVNYQNNVLTFRSYHFHHNKTWLMNNNSLQG